MNSLTDFKPITIADLLKPNNLFLTASDRIKLYVHNQLLDFLKENKIPEKRWLKRGVIQRLPQELGGQSYVFYYKTWRRELKRKITVNYNIIINFGTFKWLLDMAVYVVYHETMGTDFSEEEK